MINEGAGGADGAVDDDVHHCGRGHLQHDLLLANGIDGVTRQRDLGVGGHSGEG